MEPKKLTVTIELTAEELATNDLAEVVRKRAEEGMRRMNKELLEQLTKPMPTGLRPFFGKVKGKVRDGLTNPSILCDDVVIPPTMTVEEARKEFDLPPLGYDPYQEFPNDP